MKITTMQLKKRTNDQRKQDYPVAENNKIGVTVIETNPIYMQKWINVYNRKVFEYAEKNNIKITDFANNSVQLRENGVFAMSIREIDIAARSDLLKNKFFIDILMSGNILTEGIPSDELNGWNLRFRYNRGINWFKENKEMISKSKEIEAKGIEILKRITLELNKLKLFLWEEEKVNGFHEELLHPEWIESNSYKNTVCKI
jgi:hypothetical protein